MNINCKLIEIMKLIEISENFKKREFIVEYSSNPSYIENIKFELIQDRCNILDDFEIGDQIKVEFDLKGRKWSDPNGKVRYFNTLRAWKISKVLSIDESKNDDNQIDSLEPHENKNNDDDLPF